MAASRDLPLLLTIVFLVLIRGYAPLATESTRVKGRNVTRPLRPRGSSPGNLGLNSKDYYEDLDGVDPPKAVTPKFPNARTLQRCNYDPCLEKQVRCSVLAAETGCLCPGSTLNDKYPEAPELKSVRWNGSEVVVQWCAPYSYVTGYVVMVGRREKGWFGQDQRSGGIGDINQSALVCVAGVNDVGVGEVSCLPYEPYEDNSMALKAGLIGGGLGFLLLFTLLLLLWRHRRQRKAEGRISMQDMPET